MDILLARFTKYTHPANMSPFTYTVCSKGRSGNAHGSGEGQVKAPSHWLRPTWLQPRTGLCSGEGKTRTQEIP